MDIDRSAPIYQTTINGHAYSIAKHPGAEGLRISLRLVSAGVGSIVAAVTSGDDRGLLDAIGGVTKLLEAPDADQLVRAILKHTTRDGRPLSDEAHFSSAYAGNYGELLEAVVEVTMGNGFLPGLDTLSRLGQRFGLTLSPRASEQSEKPES